MATNKQRCTINVDDELFERIDDFRFENRFNSRAEATVALIVLGLEALKEKEEQGENIGGLLRKK